MSRAGTKKYASFSYYIAEPRFVQVSLLFTPTVPQGFFLDIFLFQWYKIHAVFYLYHFILLVKKKHFCWWGYAHERNSLLLCSQQNTYRRGKKLKKHEVLKHYFGYDDFRGGQSQLIDKILEGRDVLGIMPTGAGKSICYQVPALMLPGITIVISPLISLMKDQVYALNQAGVHAAYINSSLTERQIYSALQYAKEGRYKIIYVAPERLDTGLFLDFVHQAEISLVAVDEAHCISQWGQDFRPGYLQIAPFIDRLARRPVVCAFTATATEAVKKDIEEILKLQNAWVRITGFDRENLYFAVRHVKKKNQEMLSYVEEHRNQCGIIYCSTRNSVDEVYELLSKEGFLAGRYHAGMETEERAKNQEDFIYDNIDIMVATNAFGMGIDKSNVRYVLHYNMPQCMENYYQEAGRAGRDGEPSECMIFYSPKDVVTNRYLIEHKESKKELTREEEEELRKRDFYRLKAMTSYCTTKDCLRNYILEYFGETTEKECENCSNCLTDYEKTDVTEISKQIINAVYELRGHFGINVVLDVLRGKKNARIRSNGFEELRSYGVLSEVAESTLREVIDTLVNEDLLIRTEDRYPVLRLGAEYGRLKEESFRIYIKSEIKTGKKERTAAKKTSDLSADGLALFEELRVLRRKIAAEEQVAPFIVFADKALVDMCIKRPKNLADFGMVSGVGKNKKERYGKRFVEVIKNHKEENLH